MAYSSGIIVLIISNQPHAMCLPVLKSLVPLLPELDSTKSCYHYTKYSVTYPDQPRSQGLSSSHKREWSKKDPGSGWSRALVTKLSSWEGYQLFRKLSPLAFVTSKTRLEQSPCFLGVFIVRFCVAATGMLI